MILVDIYIPFLDQTYDFQVDENVPVENLIMEIVEMVGNETRLKINLSAENFMLCSMEQNVILKKSSTLLFYGIKNGSKLMLV